MTLERGEALLGDARARNLGEGGLTWTGQS